MEKGKLVTVKEGTQVEKDLFLEYKKDACKKIMEMK